MSLNGHLNQIASAAIVRDDERKAIKRSVNAIQQRISSHFGEDIERQQVFGSFERKTMLPRSMDQNSDVDLMIVFKNDGKKSQTYIERLVRFANQSYARSEIARSHPTAALNLSHIRFELVPAIKDWWELKIPAPRQDWQEWQETNPVTFSNELSDKNKNNENKIRPLVRVMKYWNALNGYPYASYELEQRIVKPGYISYMASWLGQEWNLYRYFYEFVSSLTSDFLWDSSSFKSIAVSRLQNAVGNIEQYEKCGDGLNAENCLRRILPLPN